MLDDRQVTLPSLTVFSFLLCDLGDGRVTFGALPQAPARNFVPCTLSPLRGGFKVGFARDDRQVTLRSLTVFSFLLCDLGDGGYVRAAALKPVWGHCPQTPSSLRGGLKWGLR